MEKDLEKKLDIDDNTDTESVDIGEVAFDDEKGNEIDNNDDQSLNENIEKHIENEEIEKEDDQIIEESEQSIENNEETLENSNFNDFSDDFNNNTENVENVENDEDITQEFINRNDDSIEQNEDVNIDDENVGENEVDNMQTKEVENVQNNDEITPNNQEETIDFNNIEMFCENCGARIIGFSKYCGGCGKKLNKKICVHCGKVIDANETTCPFCNKELNDVTSVVINDKLDEDDTETTNADNITEIMTQEEVLDEQTKQQKKKEKPIKAHKKVVNMLRKRIFLGVQLLLTFLVAIMVFVVPILTKENAIGALFKGGKGEDLASLSKILTALTSGGAVKESLISVNGTQIFIGLPFMQTILGWFGATGSSSEIALYLLLFIYGLILLMLVINFFVCGFGMLTHGPVRGKTVKNILISLVIAAIFIYPNLASESYQGYDSWILYAFVILFIYWIVVKILFYKETQKYLDSKY